MVSFGVAFAVHAAVAQFETHRQVQTLGKYGGLVGPTIHVGVLENHELVFRCGAGQQMRIGRRSQHPQSTACAECHRHRFGEIRELFLGSEKVDFISRCGPQSLEGHTRVFRAEVQLAAAIGLLAGALGRSGRCEAYDRNSERQRAV